MAGQSISEFVEGVLRSELLDSTQCDQLELLRRTAREAREIAQELLRREWLTAYQVNQIFQGKGAALTLGPYVLLERIGEGGMGQVFKAKQRVLQRVVALKVIRKECLKNTKATLRFQREIRAAGQLNHPHIVRAYDADQIDGTYYIAMEFIDGIDLARLVRDEGPLRVDRACEYIRQAALGLQHAFERGLVHRDIKPANLIVMPAVASDRRRSSGMIKRPINLDERRQNNPPRPEVAQAYPWGVVKILDMGLARCTDSLAGWAATHLTQIGAVMGTPDFIAPEQARDSHSSDVRADIYSLGCTLYFLLTGQTPFDGTMTEKLLKHQFDEPPPVSQVRWDTLRFFGRAEDASFQVPQVVEDLLARLLRKDPNERPQTPLELANEVQDVIGRLAEEMRTPLLKAEPVSANAESVVAVSHGEPSDGDLTMILTQPYSPPAQSPTRKGASRFPLWLAAGGSLALLLILTPLAILLARTSLLKANPSLEDSGVSVKGPNEPTWKRLVKKAASQRGTWEEARQEIQKLRTQAPSAEQARQFDELLTILPTPFDEIHRAKFDGIPGSNLPADVVGIYGFTKQSAAKPVASLAVTPSGRWLATEEDDWVRIFDLQGSAMPHKILAHKSRITQVTTSPDGRLLASASEDGSVRIWDIATRARVSAFEKHQRPVTRIAFSPDGSQLASLSRDGTLYLWDPRTGIENGRIDTSSSDPGTLAYAADGQCILWGSVNALCWANCKSKQRTIQRLDLSFTPRTLTVQPHGDLGVVSDGKSTLTLVTLKHQTWTEFKTLQGHQQIHAIAFSRDGSRFLSAGSEPTVTLWDSETHEPVKSWKTPRLVAHSVAFAPEGRHFALGSANGQVYVFRLSTLDRTLLRKAVE